MSLNEQQQAIVDACGNTVNVAAGAGTGKTFTLTQKIVSTVKQILEQGESKAPMQAILAITFTRKAAEELRSRVRAALIQEALQTHDDRFRECALDVDNAWISTLHSMASRILRENALEFGIDPSFELISDKDSEVIFEQALAESLCEARESKDALIQELIHTYPLYASRYVSSSVTSYIKDISSHAEYMPDGFDGLRFVSSELSPADLLKQILFAAERAALILRQEDWQEASKEQNLEDMEAAIKQAQCMLDGGIAPDFTDETFDVGVYLDAIFSFPPTSNKYPNSSKKYRPAFAEYRRAYKRVARAALSGVGSRRILALVRLSKRVAHIDARLKTTHGVIFSESDVLRVCNEKLADPQFASIRKRYQSQFASIMVDEFQDTDKLQMSIISQLAKKTDGRGHAALSNVCTVGDMQQAIYRFRGGDVVLAQERARELTALENSCFELSKNYRSHRDILEAVEVVFSRRDVFGDDFLKLEAAAGGLDEVSKRCFAKNPRITYDVLHYDKKHGISADLARMEAAMRIARRFKHLHDQGVSAGSMAILLGKTSHADIYSKALIACGMESVVAKGSIFSDSSEALLIGDLLAYAANTDDELPLFTILTSKLFNVSDDDLLMLTTRTKGVDDADEQGIVQFASRGMREGMKALSHLGQRCFASDETGEDVVVSQGMMHAIHLLETFVTDARSGCVSRALRRLLRESGIFHRLQASRSADGSIDASSMAVAANFQKALNIVAEHERGCSGVVQLAADYSDYLKTAKLTPGSLATQDSDFVQIITVHSSKGLEYDHVAVAEMKSGITDSRRFVCENYGDYTYIGMRACKDDFNNPALSGVADKVLKFETEDDELCVEIDEAYRIGSAADMFDALLGYLKQQDFEEARRLLYVAMTRAKESLLVSHITKVSPQKPYQGIYQDLFLAIQDHFNASEDGFENNCKLTQMPFGFCRTCLDEGRFEKSYLDALYVMSGSPDLRENNSASDKVDSEDELHRDGLSRKTCDLTKDNPEDSLQRSPFVIPLYSSQVSPDVSRLAFQREDVFSYSSLRSAYDATCDADDTLFSDTEANVGSDCFDVKVDFDLDCALSSSVSSGETKAISCDADKATDLGTAFHRLAELAILQRNTSGAFGALVIPDKQRISAQIKSCELNERQQARLTSALRRWFDSACAKRFASAKHIDAEVPFAVEVAAGDTCFVLEGEIDGLADQGDGSCLLIDYKTGGAHECNAEALYHKHLLQAQCYAYALLKSGYERVEANFIRVEQPISDEDDEPQIVKYFFELHDVDVLHDAIVRAYCYGMESR